MQTFFHKKGFVFLTHAQKRMIKSPWHMAVSRKSFITYNDTAHVNLSRSPQFGREEKTIFYSVKERRKKCCRECYDSV